MLKDIGKCSKVDFSKWHSSNELHSIDLDWSVSDELALLY